MAVNAKSEPQQLLASCGDALLPSTLSYAQRVQLKQQQPYAYHCVAANVAKPVVERLTADAAVRRTLTTARAAGAGGGSGGGGSSSGSGSGSGSLATTAAPASTLATTGYARNCGGSSSGSGGGSGSGSLAAFVGATAADAAPPLSALHQATLQKFAKRFPVDFLAAWQPGTRTTNEAFAAAAASAASSRERGAAAVCAAPNRLEEQQQLEVQQQQLPY